MKALNVKRINVFFKSVTILFIGGSLIFMSCAGNEKSEKKVNNEIAQTKPNLLIIHTDEHTFRSISAYDNSWDDLETPNIDELASKGARFEKFYVNNPVCSPSRASLLTGRYSQKVDTYMNDIPLKADAITFGDILKEQGYATGYGGKLHLVGATYPGIAPERNLGFEDNRFMFNNSHMKKLVIDEAGHLQSPGGIGDEKTYTTDFLTDRTIEFIDKNKDQNWCYMVSIPDPHDPNTERSPYDTLYKAENMKLPATFQLPKEVDVAWGPELERKSIQYNKKGLSDIDFLKEHKAIYYGMVKHIDDCVGRLVNHLKENGTLNNTIILFTADHGDMMGEFSRFDKTAFYEASAKVPFIVHYPEKIKSEKVVRQVVSNIDVIPTLFDLMNIPYKKESFDGQSAIDLLSDKSENAWKNRAFLSIQESVGIVTDSYKLIFQKDKEPWLFDLKKDPNELKNAIGLKENKDVVKLLSTKLKDYLEDHADPNWTDSLTYLYEQRYLMHKQYREPRIQRAKKTEVYWKEQLSNQLGAFID